MQNKGTGGNSSKRGPQNTRVYAPTHRTGASPAAGMGQAPASTQANKYPPDHTGMRQPTRQPAGRPGPSRRQEPPRTKPTERYAPGRTRTEKEPIERFEPPRERDAPLPSKKEVQERRSRNTAYAPRQERGATRFNVYESKQKPSSKETGSSGRPTEKSRKKSGQAGATSSLHRLESIGEAEKAHERELARQKKKEKKAQKQPVNPKKLIAWGIAGVSVTALLLLSYFLFLLQTVEVDGNGIYADESIIELSGLRKGEHMLLCDTAEVKRNIEKNPYLQVKSVVKELPGVIRIAIAERQEVAAIRSQEYDVIIDDTGHVLSIGKGSDLSELLLVSGMSNIGFEVNEQIGTKSDLQTQALLTLIKELQNLDLIKDVARADLSNPLNVCLYTKENITVMLGQPDGLSEKLAWMRDALPSLRKSGIVGGTLDVSARGGAIYAPAQATPTSLETPEEGETGGTGHDTPPDTETGETLPGDNGQ